jgi:hypothetical protein
MVARHPGSPAWDALAEVWEDVLRDAEAKLAPYRAGLAMPRFERLALEELLRVSRDIKAEQAWKLVSAMVLMRERDPRRFASDNAFWVQVSRRFRVLTDTHIREVRPFGSGKRRRVYGVFSVRAAVVLGRYLAMHLGSPGQRLAAMEEQAMRRKDERSRRLWDAFTEIAEKETA